MDSYLSLLRRNRDFRALWSASVITMLGDWFNTIGTVVLVSRYTDSGLAVAALFLARMLPPFVFSPIAGLVADRFSRKQIMLVSDVLRVFIVLGFLLVDSAAEAWLIYVLTAAQFIVSTFFYPTSAAVLPSLLKGKDDLLLANTLGSVTWSAMLAVGAALGGATAALFGVQVALLIDAATFAVSALLITRIRIPHIPAPTNQTTSRWQELTAGVHYVTERPRIGIVTLVKGMGQLGSINTVMTVLASTLFVYGEDGAWSLGMMMTAAGVGAVLGPLVANRFTPEAEWPLRRAIGVGFGGAVIGWLLMGQSGLFVVVLAGIMLRSMGTSTNWTYSSVLFQMNVPDHVLGRVFALDEAIRTLIASIGIVVTGVALDRLAMPVQDVATWFGVVTVVPLVLWVWFLRRQDEDEVDVVETAGTAVAMSQA